MKHWSFYSRADGSFASTSLFTENEEIVRQNTPRECEPIEGSFDPLSQRVDVATRSVIDYQPPAPDADHEWVHDDESGRRVRRWVLKAAVVARRARIAQAHARIAELAAKNERAIREHLLGIVPTAKERASGAMTLQEINDAIAEQRAIIKGEGV